MELIMHKLVIGGRAAVIVPDGVLFGASNAHKKLREMLIQNADLKAVISLPSGVFKPYAGVSTAILIFTKGDETTKVWFYDLQADGYSLDDKRNQIQANDIPDLLATYQQCVTTRSYDKHPIEADKRFWVEKETIIQNAYDLSISKYKKIVYTPVQYEKPEVLIAQIKEIELSVGRGIEKLETLLKK